MSRLEIITLVGVGLLVLALVFAFLGWLKSRGTNQRLDEVLTEVQSRVIIPTADEVAEAVLNRVGQQAIAGPPPRRRIQAGNAAGLDPRARFAQMPVGGVVHGVPVRAPAGYQPVAVAANGYQHHPAQTMPAGEVADDSFQPQTSGLWPDGTKVEGFSPDDPQESPAATEPADDPLVTDAANLPTATHPTVETDRAEGERDIIEDTLGWSLVFRDGAPTGENPQVVIHDNAARSGVGWPEESVNTAAKPEPQADSGEQPAVQPVTD